MLAQKVTLHTALRQREWGTDRGNEIQVLADGACRNWGYSVPLFIHLNSALAGSPWLTMARQQGQCTAGSPGWRGPSEGPAACGRFGGGEGCEAEQWGPFPSEGDSTHSDNHWPIAHTSRHSTAPPHPSTPGVGSYERGGTLGCRAVDVAGSLGRARHAAPAVWGRQVWSMHATRAITPRQVVFRHGHPSTSRQPATRTAAPFRRTFHNSALLRLT